MAASFDDIINSKPCKFIVGTKNNEVWVHPFLIDAHSAPLSNLVSGIRPDKMGIRVVVLPDTSQGTFVRFVEYLYKGFYTPAEPSLVEDVEDVEVESVTEAGLDTPKSPGFDTGICQEAVRFADAAVSKSGFELKINSVDVACNNRAVVQVEEPPADQQEEEYDPWRGWSKKSRKKKGKKISSFEFGDWGDEPAVVGEPPPQASVDDPLACFSVKPVKTTSAQATTRSTEKSKSIATPATESAEPPHQTTKADLIEAFKNKTYASPFAPPDVPGIPLNSDSSEVYKDVFLSHAKVYTFAAEYEIENLRLLALDNLHKTLMVFKLYPERASDVSALLEFAYEDREGDEATGKTLRALVLDYVVCHIDVMHKDKMFKRLVAGESDIAGDLMDRVVLRLT